LLVTWCFMCSNFHVAQQ